MKNPKDIAFIIQARAASQRVPNKMTRDFTGQGTTLVDIAIQKAIQSDVPRNNIIVSAFSEDIKKIARGYSVKLFHRTKRSEYSEGEDLRVLYEWWNELPCTYAVLLNPCLPFLSEQTISDFFEAYSKSSSDGMFAVTEKKDYVWDANGKFLTDPPKGAMNTKWASPLKMPAHALYAGRMSKIGQGIWMGDFSKPGDIELFSIPEEEAFDIDYEWQWDACTSLWRYKNGLPNPT